jgi:hypothetical protein
MNDIVVSGTLVVAAPCREGLVVSADSLSTVTGGHAIPSKVKLKEVPGVNGTIFTVTGVGTWMPTPPPGVDLGQWMITATPAFTIEPIIKAALAAYGDRPLAHQPLTAIAHQVGGAIMKFLGPQGLAQHHGMQICQLVVFNYERTTRASSRYKCVFVGDAKGLHIRDVDLETLNPTDVFSYWPAGETSYVAAHVESRSGFARPVWEKLLNGKFMGALPKVAETPREDAVLLCTSLIAATEEATKKIPAPSAVGGMPVTWLLTGDAPPLAIP